jgi:hypothetical protein
VSNQSADHWRLSGSKRVTDEALIVIDEPNIFVMYVCLTSM